jgi:hypothetical protein
MYGVPKLMLAAIAVVAERASIAAAREARIILGLPRN